MFIKRLETLKGLKMNREIRNRILKKFKYNKKVKVKSKKSIEFIGNYKCHLNSLSYAMKYTGKVKCIVGGVQVFTDCVVAHFVVKLKDGTFVDPTYGNMSEMYESFIVVKKYKIKDFEPLDALMNMKRTIYNQLTKKQQEEETINEF